MNRCPDCLYAIEHRDSEWHCHNPTINRSSPAFLAGRAAAAMLCVSERRNVVGRCGTPGRLFVARDRSANPLAPVDRLDV